MRRKSMFLLGAALVVAAVAGLTQDYPLRMITEKLTKGPARTEKVKDGLYVIRGPFVACTTRGCRPGGPDDGLIHEPGDVAVRVTGEGLILIDDKYPENVPEVLQQVKAISTLPVKYLLNTHHHADHASGNAVIRQMGIDIIAHKNIRDNFLRLKQPGEPNVVFTGEAAVYLGGAEVRLLYMGRGHTNGDTVIYFPDLKTVHTGDLIIDAMPVIDYSAGGSAVEFVKTIDNLLQVDFDTMIPGHGRVMKKDDVRAYRARFAEMNRRMRDIARRKVPKDQALAALKLDELGWADSVSTSAWATSISQYYDEMAALP